MDIHPIHPPVSAPDLTKRNAWEIRHLSGMQHNLPPFHMFFFCKCRANQFYQQNIAPRSFFLMVKSRPNCHGRSWNLPTKRPKRKLHSLTDPHVSIQIVLAFQSSSNHLSLLVSFRSLPLPTTVAFAVENDSRNTHKPKTYQIWADSTCLSSKQRPNADVTMKLWALGVTKERIVSIKLPLSDNEILEIAYAQKNS